MQADPFDGEFSIDDCDDDFPIRRLKRPVYNQDIAFMDSGPFHRVAVDSDKKRGCRMLNQVLIEIEILFEIIFSRGGESSLNGYSKKGEFHISPSLALDLFLA